MCISVLRFQSVVLPVFRDVRDVAEKRCSNLWSLGFVKHMRVKWGFRWGLCLGVPWGFPKEYSKTWAGWPSSPSIFRPTHTKNIPKPEPLNPQFKDWGNGSAAVNRACSATAKSRAWGRGPFWVRPGSELGSRFGFEAFLDLARTCDMFLKCSYHCNCSPWIFFLKPMIFLLEVFAWGLAGSRLTPKTV